MTTELLHLSETLADRYAIERELGHGGMATVYLARDLKHEREVALKVLREDLSASIGAARFLREIKIAAQLQHPHILPLLDSGEAGARLFFVMPYVKGESLRERLAREGELPIHEAVRLLIEIVDALMAAHAHGVVHRDIKPDNVMLSGRHALVTDFGVAKAVTEATGGSGLTTLGVAVGTPTYMSPEQAVADPHVDHRSDFYSVGAMAYEMLTGQPPFTGATPQQVLAAHVTATPEPVRKHRAAIPAALEATVMRCLEKRPADRFQSAADLLAALEPFATPSTEMTPAEVKPLATRSARPKWAIAAAAAIVALLAVGAVSFARRGTSRITPLAAFDRVQLTTSGRASSPVLSPDGKSVVFTEESCVADTLPCKERLVMQDVGTGARQTVSDTLDVIRAEQWSATGTWLLVYAADAGAMAPPQRYVMSHLGGARSPMGYVASFTPTGDTVMSVRDWILRGAKTVTVRSFAAPWTQATDSMSLAVPDRAILIYPVVLSPDRRWLAATWDLAGQAASVRTVHDREGRIVASRITTRYTTRGTWSASTLLRPVLANGLGGIERIGVDPKTGALGATDTVMLGAGSTRPDLSTSDDGALLAFDESHGGETSLSTLESASATQPYRIARRALTDPALVRASITPDGATLIYGVEVAAGNSRRVQLLAMPFAGGEARPIAAPIAELLGLVPGADSRRVIVASRDGPDRTHLVSYDLTTGRELASIQRPGRIVGLFSTSGGPGLVLDHALTFLDSTLVEKKHVEIPGNLGAFRAALSSSVRPAVAIRLQPLDFASTYQADGNFHVPLYIADTSAHLLRAGETSAWNPDDLWWLADGSFRFYGNVGADPRPSFYRVSEPGGAQQRIGIAPFHGMLTVDLSADGRRGAVVTQPRVSDIWLIRNFGAAARR